MRPQHMVIEPPPPQNQRKRGGRAEIISVAPEGKLNIQSTISEGSSLDCQLEDKPDASAPQLATEDVLNKIASMEPVSDPNTIIQSDNLYCPDCYLPLHPDPKPEKLYIFLHAMKYTTSLGAFSTEMPEWAEEGWVWDQS